VEEVKREVEEGRWEVGEDGRDGRYLYPRAEKEWR